MKRIFIASAFVAISAAAAYEPPASIFGQSNSFTATSANNLASANYTISTKFTVNTAGTITRLSFFKASSDTTTSRNLILWSTGGTNLQECTTASEPTGFAQWIGCNVTYDVSGGTTLIVSYDVPSGGHYNNDGGGNCQALAPQSWITCNTSLYANGTSTFPSLTDGATELADIVLTH